MDISIEQFNAFSDEAQRRVVVTGSLNGFAVVVDGTRVAEFSTYGTLIDGSAEALELALRIRDRIVTDLRQAAEADGPLPLSTPHPDIALAKATQR